MKINQLLTKPHITEASPPSLMANAWKDVATSSEWHMYCICGRLYFAGTPLPPCNITSNQQFAIIQMKAGTRTTNWKISMRKSVHACAQVQSCYTLDAVVAGDYRNIFDEPANVAAVTAEDVQRVAAKYFQPGNRISGHVLKGANSPVSVVYANSAWALLEELCL